MVADNVTGVQVRPRRLEPGATLAKAVYSRDGSRLYPEGKELTNADIQRLQDWNVRFVYITPGEKSNKEKVRKAS
ncbi:MAG: hypothetical protein ACLFN5_04310 [bacterium]